MYLVVECQDMQTALVEQSQPLVFSLGVPVHAMPNAPIAFLRVPMAHV